MNRMAGHNCKPSRLVTVNFWDQARSTSQDSRLASSGPFYHDLLPELKNAGIHVAVGEKNLTCDKEVIWQRRASYGYVKTQEVASVRKLPPHPL